MYASQAGYVGRRGGPDNWDRNVCWNFSWNGPHNRAESSPISHIPKNINTSHRLFDWLSRADLTARAHQNQAQESIPYSFSYYSPTALR